LLKLFKIKLVTFLKHAVVMGRHRIFHWKTLKPVAPTPYGTGARAPTFTNGWARRYPELQQTRNWSNGTDHHV